MPSERKCNSGAREIRTENGKDEEVNTSELSKNLKVKNFRILVLDDEPDCLESMADILRLEGYEVSCAGRAIDAINSIEASVPDLLLADVMLDDMSGFDVLQHLRKSTKYSNLPVIFLSGLAFSDRQDKAVELDFLDYLVKPVNFDRLLTLIEGLQKAR